MKIPTTSEVITRLRAGEAPPPSAMRVFGEVVTLAEEGNSPDAKTIKVKLKARSREPINHWYWGQIWHDLSTMRHRAKVALDDTHDVEIGHGRPVMSEYGLEIDGLVVTNPENPAHESNRIAYNLRNGIPQEASIDFGGDYDVVEVPDGLTMPVNGSTATGPCIVVQNWPLRAVAICKEGADSTTETTTFKGANAPLPRKISQFSITKEIMNNETIPAEPQGVEATPAPQTEIAPAIVEVQAVESETIVAPVAPSAIESELEATQQKLVEAEAKIVELEARIVTLSAGASPVPVAAVKELQTWAEALALLKAEHPTWAEWQIHTEAQTRFAALFQKLNAPK